MQAENKALLLIHLNNEKEELKYLNAKANESIDENDDTNELQYLDVRPMNLLM